MPGAILKRYHTSVGKSVTSFMVGRRRKARCFSALQNDAIGKFLAAELKTDGDAVTNDGTGSRTSSLGLSGRMALIATH
jgi:hypothetical protein